MLPHILPSLPVSCTCHPFVPQDPSLLNGKVTLHQVMAGTVLSRQGDQVSEQQLGQPQSGSACPPTRGYLYTLVAIN